MHNLRGNKRRLTVQPYRDDAESVCIAGHCQAAADPDSPVALCASHGARVFQHYTQQGIAKPRSVSTTGDEQTRGASRPGFVYFVRQQDAIKIGWTRDVERRAAGLGADAVLHYESGTRHDEARLHAAFDHLLIEGRGREWFRPESDLMSFILRLKIGAA